MKILFYPPFPDAETLREQYYRLHWYLYPFRDRISTIRLACTDDATVGAVPGHLDPELPARVGTLPVEITRARRASEVTRDIAAADVVFVWSKERAPEDDWPAALGEKQVLKVDDGRQRFASSIYLRFAQAFPDLESRALARSEEVFARISARCSSEVGHVYGTGPSLGLLKGRKLPDGVAIACNSMVRNRTLLDRLQPALIVAADPIFHAGCSSYAATFRRELAEALERYEADLIVPSRDYHVYTSSLPAELRDRVAGVPFRKGEEPNLDLAERFWVTTTGNVLTLFLIPLAATLFDRVRIAGCDGRPLSERGYFWTHDEASQINEEMAAIRRAHPAFFDVDYDRYYATHANVLDRWLVASERTGLRIENVTPSHLPALMERTVPAYDDDTRTPVVSVVMAAGGKTRFFDAAVRSVLDQDLDNLELLVVDDGSDDETAAFGYRWAMSDSRVTLLRSPTAGMSAARNVGLAKARGEYVGFLDADGVLETGALRARVDALQEARGAQLVHGPTRFVDEDDRDLNLVRSTSRRITFQDTAEQPVSLSSVLVRGDIARRLRFQEGVESGADWWFLARILRSGVVSDFVGGGGVTERARGSARAHAMNGRRDGETDVIEWLYEQCHDPDVAAEWRDGLTVPSQGQARAMQLARRLLWALVARDRKRVKRLMAAQPRVADHLSGEWLERAAVWAGVHYFMVPVAGLRNMDAQVRSDIAELLVDVRLAKRWPALAEACGSVFGIANAGDHREAADGRATVAVTAEAPSADARARARSPKLSFVARFAIGFARAVRRHPGWSVAYGGLLASATAAAVIASAWLWALSGLLVIAAATMVSVGYTTRLVGESQRKSKRQHVGLRKSLDQTREELRSTQRALEERIDGGVADVRAELLAAAARLDGTVAQLRSQQEASLERLERQPSADASAVRADGDAAVASLRARHVSPPRVVAADVECVWTARAQLGESPCWDQRSERLVWIDIEGLRLHAFSPARRDRQTWELGTRLCSLDVPSPGWESPPALRGQAFVGCGDLGLVWIGLGDAGVDLVPIADPEQSLPHNRYNDGKMGPDGRYWAGTMDEDEMNATGNLYAFRPDGGWSLLDRGYVVANGPAFNGEGTVVYHTDSAARAIYAFDLCANGALAGKRTFVRFEEEDGFPDGMSVDGDGNLWVAMWDGGRLEMIEPTGARRGIVELPIQRPTSCVFAEPDSQQLFVTSARRGVQGDEPAPGGLFSVRLR